MKIDGENFSAYLDRKGNVLKIAFKDKLFEPPMKDSLYEINGEIADVSSMSSEKELSLKLTTTEVSGELIISPGKEIRFHLEPYKKDAAKNASLVLSYPLETEFHLPEYMNLGRKIDGEMPVGEQYSMGGYNFFLANLRGMWIRFMTKQTRLRSARVHISRYPEVFIVTLTWNLADDAFMAVFSSMNEAIKDYETWLEKELGIRKLRENSNVPEWVHNVKLVLFVDMMRSNWEIAHDYNDVINLAEELNKIGCPKDTLFYIPGWNGAYDSTYPTYRPHPELGGEEKFKEMMETLHKNGFRVMIHTNPWGLDPYHPKIDKYEKYVRRDEDGNYRGWQTGGMGIVGGATPPSRTLKLPSNKTSIHCPKRAMSFTFETVYVPHTCEALITVGNLKVGGARVKFTIDRRTILTPPGWFKDHEEYAFPFPLLLQRGRNKVQAEVIGEEEPDWSNSWYKIRRCFISTNPYSVWSHPILNADTSNLEWIKIFVDEVESVVRKYHIDAVHADSTVYDFPPNSKQLLHILKERLPDIPISGEWFRGQEMGYWTFSQGANQSSLDISALMELMRMPNSTMLDILRKQGSLLDRGRIEKTYSWLNKPSPVSGFVKDYLKIYPHLCAADAFVPVGKVCYICPPRLSLRSKEELWKALLDAEKLNYIPGLRLNYREYGLDEETKKAIQEIASWK